MKTKTLPLLVALLMSSLSPAVAEDVEALWKKIETSINDMKKPKTPPKSREEAVEFFKPRIADFDVALAEFEKAAPNDARRWDGRLFQVETTRLREVLELPAAKVDLAKLSEEASKAPDASDSVKGEFSAMSVLNEVDAVEAGGDVGAWVKKAEEHLKTHPSAKMNRTISSKMKTLQAQAELRTKPLDLKFTAVDGREVDLASMRGKVVLIDFWATWCGPCVAELPNVLKTYAELHPKGFEIIGISLDQDKGKLEKFVKEKAMEWPQYFDGQGWKNEISSRHGINSIPAMWLVNKKGMVVNTNARDSLHEEAAKLLAE